MGLDRAPAALLTSLAAVALLVAFGVEPFAGAGPLPLAFGTLGLGLAVLTVAVTWTTPPHVAAGVAVVAGTWIVESMHVLARGTGWIAAMTYGVGSLALVGSMLLLRAPRGLWTIALVPVVVHVLAYDPLRDPACDSPCSEVSAPLAAALGARPALGLAVGAEAIVVLAVILLAASRFVRARLPLVPLSVAVSALCVLVADAVPWLRWGALMPTSVDEALRAASVAVVVTAGGVLAQRRLRAQSGLRHLVRRLQVGGAISGIQFAVPGTERWVDIDGRDLVPTTGTVLGDRHGEPAVCVPVNVEIEPDAALRLALDNARLGVIAQVRVADLRASQERIVERGDTERRRIERDLHDGAQQELVAASMHLGALGSPAATAVQQQLHAALAALRDISHGALLAVLCTDGLVAALEDLCDSTGASLSVGDLPSLEPSIERAAYAVVAGSAFIEVRIEAGDGQLVVEVTGELTDDVGVADRVGATGGTLVRGDGVLRAEWPCVW